MEFRKLGAVMLTAALLAGTTASVSLAQQPKPQAEGQRGEMRQRMTPEQRTERRAEHLRAVLQLRPDQETALRTFLQSSGPKGDREGMRGKRGEMANMTTPQRLDQMAARMKQRQARFEQRAAATKRFYAQLSPAQQKAFDAMAPRGRGKGGDRGGPGHGMGRHGG